MNYLIRNIPLALWIRFKVRAAQERVPMRTLILRLLQNYCAEPYSAEWLQAHEHEINHEVVRAEARKDGDT